ncbi:MAG: hypothetical protein J5849_01715 [Clostridia bacterium]|nr:hypothetical protein [Clostridia bacterium]
MRDIEPILEKVRKTVASHRLSAEGEYARTLLNLSPGEKPRINEYGVADAANILYTLGDFSPSPVFREGFVSALKSLQHRDTGLFSEPTHSPVHTTAHCTAALELFDERPLPPKDLLPYLDKGKLYALLDSLEWVSSPWNNSHIGAGIYVSLALSGAAGRDWEDAYFSWLWEEADPATGLWRKGAITAPGSRPLYEHMAGSFHYLFNHQYAARPLRYPDRMVDTQIDMFRNHVLRDSFGTSCGFLEIDWIYCLNRATRETPHRFYEAKEVLREFAKKYFDYLEEADPEKDRSFDDLHSLFGATCAVAELYRALPGEFTAAKPLKLVLDRRPFI